MSDYYSIIVVELYTMSFKVPNSKPKPSRNSLLLMTDVATRDFSSASVDY